MPNGMPMVGMLASGTVAGNQTLVLSTNESNWARFDVANGLGVWALNARNNTMNVAYQTQTIDIRNVVAQNVANLQAAWNAGAVGAKDGAVMAAWNGVAMPVGLPHSLTRPLVLSAMSFTPRWTLGGTMPRCRRCRVVYRYNMGTAAVVEPERYDLPGGAAVTVYGNALSCAEVTCYTKCARYNL